MKKDQLFKKNPSNELFQKVLNAFGLTDLNDKRSFSRKDLQYIKTVNKVNELKNELNDCYLPCKARTYLSGLTEKNVITILRQILKTRNYTIVSREKYMKGCKFIIYNLTKLEQQIYKPLTDIPSETENTDTDKPIVLTFN
tara:strand:+ start:2107 stop:2529 length:423 start_codon:yes stop_codon:yes gene_type:complete